MAEVTLKEIKEFASAEQDALKTFDFGALEELLLRKERLAEALYSGGVEASEDDLIWVRQQLETNGRLYTAALHGLRSARTKLSEVKSVSEGFDSYGPDGERRASRQKPGSLERRA